MAIRIVLFDLDGTLLDTNELIIQSFQYTYKKHLEKEVPREEIIKTFGEILKNTFERECKGCVEEALGTYRHFQMLNFNKLITIHTGVKEGLKALHRKGYKLGVVTSRLNDSALKGLRMFDIEHYFDSIIGASDTNKHKPDPTPIYMALEELGGDPKEAVMIGDSPYDILCAKNAGVQSIVVSWSALPREMYMQYHPDHVVESMEALVAWIEQL
jgi:pyrophosphatase PpaX